MGRKSDFVRLRIVVTIWHTICRQTVSFWLQNSALERRIRPTDYGK
jgi:hypothetical protein